PLPRAPALALGHGAASESDGEVEGVVDSSGGDRGGRRGGGGVQVEDQGVRQAVGVQRQRLLLQRDRQRVIPGVPVREPLQQAQRPRCPRRRLLGLPVLHHRRRPLRAPRLRHHRR
ncbi:unnamed protein product, partial [Musa textilis]